MMETTGVNETTTAAGIATTKVFEKREQHSLKAGIIDLTAGSLGEHINQFIMKFQ